MMNGVSWPIMKKIIEVEEDGDEIFTQMPKVCVKWPSDILTMLKATVVLGRINFQSPCPDFCF